MIKSAWCRSRIGFIANPKNSDRFDKFYIHMELVKLSCTRFIQTWPGSSASGVYTPINSKTFLSMGFGKREKLSSFKDFTFFEGSSNPLTSSVGNYGRQNGQQLNCWTKKVAYGWSCMNCETLILRIEIDELGSCRFLVKWFLGFKTLRRYHFQYENGLDAMLIKDDITRCTRAVRQSRGSEYTDEIAGWIF